MQIEIKRQPQHYLHINGLNHHAYRKISLTHFNGSERFCGSGNNSIRWNKASSIGRSEFCAPAIRSNWMAVK